MVDIQVVLAADAAGHESPNAGSLACSRRKVWQRRQILELLAGVKSQQYDETDCPQLLWQERSKASEAGIVRT